MPRDSMKVSHETKTRLESYRDRHEHTSFDSAVRTLLDAAETPLPTDGIDTDTVPKDALRVAEHFNIADRTYPLPDSIGSLLSDIDPKTPDSNHSRDDPTLTRKFRLHIAGHWLFNSKAHAWGPSYLPHFDAFSLGNDGFLFKLRTEHNAIHRPVSGLPEGEFWFVLDDETPYEDSVLAVTKTENVEFLAPAGGPPESDEADSLPPFGGYDGYWSEEAGGVEQTEGFHDLRRIPEFIAEDGVALFAGQLAHRVDMEQTWAEEEAADSETRTVDTNQMALPIGLAIRLHLLSPSMTLSPNESDAPLTVGEVADEAPDQRIEIPFMPQVLSPLQVLEHMHADDYWPLNPNGDSRQQYVTQYCISLANKLDEQNPEAMDLTEDDLDDWADAVQETTDTFPDPETVPNPQSLPDNTYYLTLRMLVTILEDTYGIANTARMASA